MFAGTRDIRGAETLSNISFLFIKGRRQIQMFGERANEEVRDRIRREGLRQYQVAFCIGITPERFSEWLAVPMTEKRRKRTLNGIELALKERSKK